MTKVVLYCNDLSIENIIKEKKYHNLEFENIKELANSYQHSKSFIYFEEDFSIEVKVLVVNTNIHFGISDNEKKYYDYIIAMGNNCGDNKVDFIAEDDKKLLELIDLIYIIFTSTYKIGSDPNDIINIMRLKKFDYLLFNDLEMLNKFFALSYTQLNDVKNIIIIHKINNNNYSLKESLKFVEGILINHPHKFKLFYLPIINNENDNCWVKVYTIIEE